MLTGWLWQIHLGTVLTPEQCKAYRASWRSPAPPTSPGPIQQALGFVQALQRWQAAGRPRPSPEELAQRQAACRACPYHNAAANKCGRCGCDLDSQPILFGLVDRPGKLDMASEECPDTPPRWLKLA